VKNIEIEIKFMVLSSTSAEDIGRFLKENGYLFQSKETQDDVYYDVPNYSIVNLKRGLRLRDSAGKISFEYKSLFSNKFGKLVVEEVDLLDNGYLRLDRLKEILVKRHKLDLNIQADIVVKDSSIAEYLESLGLIRAIVLKKERTNYQDRDNLCTISLDYVVDAGVFIEVEVNNGDERLLDKITSLFLQMKGLVVKRTNDGYLNILRLSNSKLLSSAEFEKKFREKYDWNVMLGEMEIVRKLFE